MTTRYLKNSVLVVSLEETYGTDPIASVSSCAILVANLTLNLNYNNVDRNLIKGHFGASEQLVGTRFVEITCDVEIAGSGTKSTPPPWNALLLGCGTVETIAQSLPVCVEYSPITIDFQHAPPSFTVYYFLDGIKYKALGCRADVEFKMSVGERPIMSYRIVGIDGGAVLGSTAASWVTSTSYSVGDIVKSIQTGYTTKVYTCIQSHTSGSTNEPPTGANYADYWVYSNETSGAPSVSFVNWGKAEVITHHNTTGVVIGCDEYAPNDGEINSGTIYTNKGFSFKLGNDVKYIPLVGKECVEITAREVTGNVTLELSPDNEINFKSYVENNEFFTFAFIHGINEGNRIITFFSNVQFLNMKHEDSDGIVLVSFDLRFPPASKNSDFTIITA